MGAHCGKRAEGKPGCGGWRSGIGGAGGGGHTGKSISAREGLRVGESKTTHRNNESEDLFHVLCFKGFKNIKKRGKLRKHGVRGYTLFMSGRPVFYSGRSVPLPVHTTRQCVGHRGYLTRPTVHNT